MSSTEVPETVMAVLNAPEIVAAITALACTLLGGITVIVKLLTKKFEEKLARIAKTADATHDQVANNHDLNLRDDLDQISGMMGEIREKLEEQDRHMREDQHEQAERDRQSEERILEIRKDLRTASENAVRDRELLHRRVSDTRAEVRNLSSETKRRFTEVDETIRRLHPEQ